MVGIFLLLTFIGYVSSEASGPQRGPCDLGWLYFDGSCYLSSNILYNVDYGDHAADWFASQLFCQSQGGTLAFFEDEFEKQFILSLAGCESSWISLVWAATLSDQTWTWWNNPKNDNVTIDQYVPGCDGHVPSAGSLQWVSTPDNWGRQAVVLADFPDTKKPFVCKKPSNNSSGICHTGFVSESSGCCPPMPNTFKSKWFIDKEHELCYTMPMLNETYGSNDVDYFAAQLTCQESGFHLVSIHSQLQNDLVGVASLCQDVWIGLENIRIHDVCDCSGWAWEDGSSKNDSMHSICDDYTNNWFNQTNNPDTLTCNDQMQCGYIVPGLKVQTQYNTNWYNDFCYQRRKFLCVVHAAKWHQDPIATSEVTKTTTPQLQEDRTSKSAIVESCVRLTVFCISLVSSVGLGHGLRLHLGLGCT